MSALTDKDRAILDKSREIYDRYCQLRSIPDEEKEAVSREISERSLGDVDILRWMILQIKRRTDEAIRDIARAFESSNRTALALKGRGLCNKTFSVGIETLVRGAGEVVTNLSILWLSSNYLVGFPNLFDRFTRLRELDLSDNPLESEPPTDWLDGLSQLASLRLDRTPLRVFPEGLRGKPLSNLSLKGTSIFHLPDWLGTLRSLWCLNVANTPISELPSSIGALARLYMLFLSGSRISTLCPELGACSSLRVLDVSDTPLTRLPESLKGLRLRELYLDRTRLSSFRAVAEKTNFISARGMPLLRAVPERLYPHLLQDRIKMDGANHPDLVLQNRLVKGQMSPVVINWVRAGARWKQTGRTGCERSLKIVVYSLGLIILAGLYFCHQQFYAYQISCYPSNQALMKRRHTQSQEAKKCLMGLLSEP